MKVTPTVTARLKMWADAIGVIGRRSETAYLRFYPNPGFMLPWFSGKSLLWNKHDGWFTRPVGSRIRPTYHRKDNK